MCAGSSGKSEKRRSRSERRPSFAAVFKVERSSNGCHPYWLKNCGPSSGANFNGTDPVLKSALLLCCSILSSPGEAMSKTQCLKGPRAGQILRQRRHFVVAEINQKPLADDQRPVGLACERVEEHAARLNVGQIQAHSLE